MNLNEYIYSLSRSKCSDAVDPLAGYIAYVSGFVGNQDLVQFCFDALLSNVDFEVAERAVWSDVCPDFTFIQVENLDSQKVKIYLGDKLKPMFQEAWEQRITEYVFENQHALVVRIGAIILLSTGYTAYDLKNFEALYAKRKNETSIRKNGETRLCLEPWTINLVASKGEVLVCSQISTLWDIQYPEEMYAGITYFQQSLLEAQLNHICTSCTLKSATTIENLQQAVEKIKNKSTARQLVNALQQAIEKNTGPVPPPHLRFRISGSADKDIFALNGIQGASQMMDYVAKYGQYPGVSLLDWGCGCGRYAHHIIQKWKQISYTGCDIDAEAIDWCKNNIEDGVFEVISPYPPTIFKDGQFSAIIASSVMTHLSEKNQQLWLKEMTRILKPGGIFIASTLGITAASSIHGMLRKITKSGFVDAHADPGLDGIAPKGYYRDVFQTETYTRQYWTTFFEVKEFINAGLMGYQDLVILQKKKEKQMSHHA